MGGCALTTLKSDTRFLYFLPVWSILTTRFPLPMRSQNVCPMKSEIVTQKWPSKFDPSYRK